MRGFPLLNTLLVLAGFAVAWWPLKQTATGSGATTAAAPASEEEVDTTDDSAEPRATPATLRVFASAPLDSLRIEFLGRTLIDLSSPKTGNGGVIEWKLPALTIPAEGVEFWVEAIFSESNSESKTEPRPAALGIELTPGSREARKVTLWTADFDPRSVADSVDFAWDP